MPMSPRLPSPTRLAALCLPVLLAGCAAPAGVALPPSLLADAPPRTADTAGPAPLSGATGVERLPGPPASTRPAPPPAVEPSRPAPKSPTASLNFDQVPLTTVIQVVYADILGRTVQLDPKVAERRDLVTLRTPEGEAAERVEAALNMILRSYGLAVIDAGGLVRIVPDGAQSGLMPDLRRGSTLPETPAAMRTIFQLVDLSAVRNNEVAGWLKTLFGNRLTVQEDAGRNALMLSGTGANVAAALNVIKELDQPAMTGRASLRLTPVFWSVSELAQTLTQVLTAEGYAMPPPNQVAQPGGVRYPIVLLPVPGINSLLVFAANDQILEHVRQWTARLDQPGERSGSRNIFTYTARHLSADALARTLSQLLDGGGAGAAAGPSAAPAAAANAPSTPGATRPAAGSGAAAGRGTGRVVVDPNSNTLIFNTSPENYSQLIGLLSVLDRPAKSALIEVTVAEVSLTDDLNLGVEWLMQNSGASGSTVTGSTLGGLGLGTAGLTIRRLNSAGDLRLVINALAGSDRATILSSPRVMARNGEQARIQVGQEVPIITSQQSSLNNNAGDNLGVLQTVQYRDTGVLLTVKPSIYSGDRIDLDVVQEVSAAQTTQTGVTSSPTIATRKVETRLTLEHGATVLLGGLISSDRSDGDGGVPGLKDVPLLGNLFKRQTRKDVRRELIVLITPYIINDGQEAAQITEAFRNALPLLGRPQGAGGAAAAAGTTGGAGTMLAPRPATQTPAQAPAPAPAPAPVQAPAPPSGPPATQPPAR